ncbi:glycoside hydrolase family 16 protein [Cereibacter sphaeroides]|uniref:glycoside hydrolase family 16 protein n=1 Tax=Cereibacter sphaeroides TaxID=1063 RepID=UPI001F3C3999|nr:glycoside hydrolase family 16 protein [Cereibacter sphaeroides]MCE6952719.1 glycoside hydrolase family 16 protein [Cereibacter sphaeroides]
MGIDPDIQPFLDELAARVAALECATPASPDLTSALARIAALETRTAGAATALAGGLVQPEEPEIPAVVLPAGYRLLGDFRRARGDAAQWGTDELIMTTWQGGAGTMGDPSLITWGSDGTALLQFRDGNPPRAGVMQLNRPQKALGRWGMIAGDIKPGAVAAFFTYAGNGREFDFELGQVSGKPTWIIGIHQPKPGGGTVSSAKKHAALTEGAHRYEIEATADAVVFSIDGAEVARFTAADVPGATWDTTSAMEAFCSVEKHGSWAGWAAADYAANTAQMRVHALML